MKSRKRMSKSLQLSLLGSVLDFMVGSGLSEAELRDSIEKALRRSLKASHGRPVSIQYGKYLPEGDLAADMLRMWHRENRYLDAHEASPRPLRLTIGRNSLRAMSLRLDPNADFKSLMEFLKASGLIERTSDGRYLPKSDGGAITTNDPFVAEHLAKSVVRLISTISRNTAKANRQPLVERFAYVSDLNRSDINNFCEFTKEQGLSYLQAVDDWMEQRRAGRRAARVGSKPTGVVAGVQVIAYLGDRIGPREKRMIEEAGKQGIEGTDAQRQG